MKWLQALDQPAFNRNRLKGGKLIYSYGLEQLVQRPNGQGAALGIFLIWAAPAFSHDKGGCETLAWPLEKERELLASPDKSPSEGLLSRDSGKAIIVQLKSLKDADLPKPPERAPKSETSYAGKAEFSAGLREGVYHITLPRAAWIDVLQDGRYVNALAFTGAHECAGLRKSVRFRLNPQPFTLQISDSAVDFMSLVITPAEIK